MRVKSRTPEITPASCFSISAPSSHGQHVQQWLSQLRADSPRSCTHILPQCLHPALVICHLARRPTSPTTWCSQQSQEGTTGSPPTSDQPISHVYIGESPHGSAFALVNGDPDLVPANLPVTAASSLPRCQLPSPAGLPSITAPSPALLPALAPALLPLLAPASLPSSASSLLMALSPLPPSDSPTTPTAADPSLSPLPPLDSPTTPTAADPSLSPLPSADPPTTCTVQTPITTAAALPATAPDGSADRIDVSNVIHTSLLLASNSSNSLPPSLSTVKSPPPPLHNNLATIRADLAPDLSQAAIKHYEDIDNFLKLSGLNENGKKKKKKKKKKTPDPPSLPDNPVLFYV
ncbi:hypothetical protein PCANC_22265 [Puccinia coronata f. sp. avenae]|uniref:Uncharacterized protein n=1 Tax=Puccinia coronata f. sp. avenae TaxID=200324 RepID=A0A2N5UTN3_9BASI|nr:hypothetical protein PCANC_22265 [Puccinia coronata f. sp. avenae]